jgi:hypothetical protein
VEAVVSRSLIMGREVHHGLETLRSETGDAKGKTSKRFHDARSTTSKRPRKTYPRYVFALPSTKIFFATFIFSECSIPKNSFPTSKISRCEKDRGGLIRYAKPTVLKTSRSCSERRLSEDSDGFAWDRGARSTMGREEKLVVILRRSLYGDGWMSWSVGGKICVLY